MVTASVASSSIRTRGCSRLLKRAAGLGALIAVCGAGMPQASAQFVKLADFDTFVPGGSFLEYTSGLFPAGTDKFNGFGAPAISDGGTVVFLANSSGTLAPQQVTGLFRVQATGGRVEEFVTRRTWLPEFTGLRSGATAPNNQGEGVFLGFNSALLEVKNGWAVFGASTLLEFGAPQFDANVYSIKLDKSNLQHLLNANESRSPSGTYAPIHNVAGSNVRVVVQAGSPAGLYQRGELGNTTIVDSTIPIPGASVNFFVSNFVEHAVHPGGVTFVAQAPSGGNAIWRKTDTSLSFDMLRRSDPSGTLSDAPFRLVTFNQLRADTSWAISFIGGSPGNAQTGIFTQRTSTELEREAFSVIATNAMAAPSGTGTFKSFTRMATWSTEQRIGSYSARYLDTDVVFTATDEANKVAIYAYLDDQVNRSGARPQVQRVIGVGDTLDGKKIAGVEIGRNAIFQGTVAFSARFEDGTQAIYTVPVARLVPRSGVTVRTEARVSGASTQFFTPNVVSGETSASSTSSSASSVPPPGAMAAAGDGVASPLTGGVRVRASAYVEGGATNGMSRTEVVATQRFIVLGDSVGDVVDIDLRFSFNGVLGVTQGGSSTRMEAGVDIEAYLYQPGSRVDLFSGDLVLTSGSGLERNGAFAEPEAINDAVGYLDPFGDGKEAVGVFVDAEREFLSATTARVGETLAVQYVLAVYARASANQFAIADFSRTFDAFASTDTLGASLAMIYAAPVPEPEQVLLMLCGLALLFARLRKAQRKT